MDYKYTALVSDNYQNSETIKLAERARRGAVQMQEIRNPERETPIPQQKVKYLSNTVNKLNLADFVFNDLVELCKDQLPNERTVFLGGGFKDPKKAARVEKDVCISEESLEPDHEEADSRMFVHIDHAVRNLNVHSVVLWRVDSDVAALCPRNARLLNIKLFFRTGAKEKRVVELRLGDNISQALPVIHALSGSDSTSSFYGVGKKRWFTTMEKNPAVLEGTNSNKCV